MNSKNAILKAIGDTDSTPDKVPEFDLSLIEKPDPNNLFKRFEDALKAAGGELVVTETASEDAIRNTFDAVDIIADTRKDSVRLPETIESVDLAIFEAEFAVAENGAVWIDPKERYPRSLLTLPKYLAIVLPEDRIVATMHEAYESIDFEKIAYALFLCGPSKTADIEQSLVIGAHGAVGLKVFVTQ